MTTTAVPMSVEAMHTDLRLTFPALRTRPLQDFGVRGFTEGFWTDEESAHSMPDGLRIFDNISALAGDDAPDYDGTVHAGFVAWLDARGWYVERYDGLTYFLVPDRGAPDAWPRQEAAQ